MIKPTQLYKLALAILLAGSLQACASFDKCAPENCAGDAKITHEVNEMIVQNRQFGAPAAFHIQTINGIVYLNGMVDTDLESREIESRVRSIPNVNDVVNSLTVRNTGR
jgi:osmotically-inducible protein OsmY